MEKRNFDGPEGPQDDPKMAPRWPHDGLKIAQDGPVVKPRALDVLSVMARSSIQIDTITCNTITCNIDVSAWEKDGECLSYG